MDRKSLGLLGVVLTFGALMRPETAGPPKPAGSQAASARQSVFGNAGSSTAFGATDPGPLEAVSAFFGLRNATGSTPPSIPETVHPRFLIATVPDPDSTHLALYFDRTVESLMWAIGDVGFSFERYWLPWTTAPEKDLLFLEDRVRRKKEIEIRKKQPGILIFRHKNTSTVLFAFIVGETPTAGLNKDAFANALEHIRTLRGADSKTQFKVDVAGPSFSGSLLPLAAALETPLKEGVFSFHFVSGTVTSAEVIHQFRTLMKLHPVKYESVVENDHHAAELFSSYVEAMWQTPSGVAILSEDDTVYGATFARDRSGSPRTHLKPHSLLKLRYPREISRLRNAYQEEAALAPANGRLAATPSPGVRLTLKEGPDAGPLTEKDSLVAFSRLQSPASQQAALLGIAGTLRRERYDLAGIVATDVLDAVFLSRFLKLACPDTRVFMLDSDLLFLGESDADSLFGLLSITTYPLFSRNQHWTAPAGSSSDGVLRRIQFTSRYAEGTYNACRRLIHDEQDREFLLDYSPPGREAGPQAPLWLTIVGRDGYWPLALLDERANDSAESSLLKSYPSGELESLHPEAPGRGWFLCFWTLSLMSILHCIHVRRLLDPVKAEPSHAFFKGLFNSLAKLFAAYPRPDKVPPPQQQTFLLAGTVSAACALFVLTAPLARFLTHPLLADWVPWYLRIGLLAFISLLVIAFRLTDWSSKYVLLSIPSWFMLSWVCGGWVRLLAAPEYKTGYFLAYRSLNMTNGVAPCVPILLLVAAYFHWSAIHLKRESMAADLRDIIETNPSKLPGAKHMRAVDKSIEQLFSTNIWIPALPFLLVWFLLFVPWHSFRSFEYKLFNWVYIILLGTLYWALAVNWMQLMWCWSSFKKFLQWLERRPGHNAFSRLRKEISWAPLVTRPREHPLFISTRSLDCLKAIDTFDGSTLPRLQREQHEKLKELLKPETVEVRQRIDAIDRQISDGKPIPRKVYRALQWRLDSVALKIIDELEQLDQGDSDSLRRERDLADKKAPDPQESLAILKEEFVALRYLMYIRYVIRHLRNLLGFVVSGFILSVLSTSSYPFQGRRWIGLASTITLVALGIGVGRVFAQLDRDAILSRLSDTKANEVGKTFYVRLAQFGALPLLTVLASQFPSINSFLFSWVQPALEALK